MMNTTSQTPDMRLVIEDVSALLKAEDFNGAIALCEEQLNIYPEQPDLKVRLAFALHKAKQYQQAEQLYRELIDAHEQAILYFNLGCVLTDSKKNDDAIEAYKKALILDPKHKSAHNNLGNLLRSKGDPLQAINHFLAVQKINPKHVNSLNGLGACYASLGQHEKSVEYFRKTIALNPDDYNAHTNLGIELLLLGQFDEGWREYNWRFLRPDLKRHLTTPHWQGEDLEKKRLHIYAEQGAGDVIQFLRFIPHIKTLGAEIILECHKDLYTLCFQQTGIDIVVAYGTKVPKCDYHVPLLSLAAMLNVNLDNIPDLVPYLCTPEAKRQQWKDYFKEVNKLKVGIVWAGNPKHPNDLFRSCDLSMFMPFLTMPEVAYYSLQKNFEVEQLADLPSEVMIDNLADKIFDYTDTAACIEQLDIVITVDTSVAHMAGALGKNVWVLIPYVPDWRWMLNSENTPWYPTMRLFRQEKIGDWTPVVNRIADSLSASISSSV